MERSEEKRGECDKATLNKIIDLLCSHKYAEPFLKPVDYVRLGLVDYPLVIRQPMDLETVRGKLRDHKYRHGEECLLDLRLIWENCRKYNDGTNKVLVKWANEMENYQHRITKNYLPTPRQKGKHTHRLSTKRQNAVKIEAMMPEVKIQACKVEERLENKALPNAVEVKAEVKAEVKLEAPAANVNVHLESLAIQAQSSLQKISEVGQKITPKGEWSTQEGNKWQALGHQIRQLFLSSLEQCNDCEVTLIFMMIKRRCFHCIEFDRQGNSTINLAKIDDYTLALAKTQIEIWKNKKRIDTAP